MVDLIYINLIPDLSEQYLFSEKVRDVANRLQTNPDWLMQVMKAESGLSASIRNTFAPAKDIDGNVAYATGLIQFMPSTARALGTTTWDLEKMSRVDQMEYVYKYLKPYTGNLKSYFDVYLTVFFPAAIPHSTEDNWVFETKGLSAEKIAKANPTMDINKDGKITMAEFRQYLQNTVKNPTIYERVFGAAVTVVDTAKKAVQTVEANPTASIAVGIGVAGIGGYFVWKYFIK
jgi:hypothetical protein